jgi:hypothetical protein
MGCQKKRAVPKPRKEIAEKQIKSVCAFPAYCVSGIAHAENWHVLHLLASGVGAFSERFPVPDAPVQRDPQEPFGQRYRRGFEGSTEEIAMMAPDLEALGGADDKQSNEVREQLIQRRWITPHCPRIFRKGLSP